MFPLRPYLHKKMLEVSGKRPLINGVKRPPGLETVDASAGDGLGLVSPYRRWSQVHALDRRRPDKDLSGRGGQGAFVIQ